MLNTNWVDMKAYVITRLIITVSINSEWCKALNEAEIRDELLLVEIDEIFFMIELCLNRFHDIINIDWV
ncbi:3753_t:CDS:1, partial [Cetraspora pellucida]